MEMQRLRSEGSTSGIERENQVALAAARFFSFRDGFAAKV